MCFGEGVEDRLITHLLLAVSDVLGCADIGIEEAVDVVDGELEVPDVSIRVSIENNVSAKKHMSTSTGST